MTDRMEVSDMGRKKQISDQRRLYTERMRLQKGVFSSLANAAGHIGELYADFVQSDEVPEALLRKIVREETAGRQTSGGSYRFTAQINRRTLFDEMMKEAQMRRDTSGRNPFEMA